MYYKVTEDFAILPEKNQDFKMEISVAGPQDFECAEMYAVILHKPLSTSMVNNVIVY